MNYDNVSSAELAARLRTPGLLCLPEVGSTLDIVHELAAEGAPAGTLVLTDMQTRGRGRQGRSWHSPPGIGVWLGYLVRVPHPLETGLLSLRVGLAMAEALADLGAGCRLKWPNDVLVADRKVAGILCEGRSVPAAWVAVGIGVNVRGPLPEAIADTATTLDAHVPDVTRVGLLERLVPRLHMLSSRPELSDSEREAYRRHDWLFGRRLLEPVDGTALGIDADGALLVETGNGTRRVLTGTVRAA